MNVFEYYSGQLGAYTNVQYDKQFGFFKTFLLILLCRSGLVLAFWSWTSDLERRTFHSLSREGECRPI